MSFASQAREEIARRSLQKDCCVRAAAYGIACFAKYFDASGLVLQTEQELTTQVAAQLFARCGVQGEIVRKERPSGVRSPGRLPCGMQGECGQTAAAPVSPPVRKPALAHGVHHARSVFASVFLWRICLRPL